MSEHGVNSIRRAVHADAFELLFDSFDLNIAVPTFGNIVLIFFSGNEVRVSQFPVPQSVCVRIGQGREGVSQSSVKSEAKERQKSKQKTHQKTR